MTEGGERNSNSYAAGRIPELDSIRAIAILLVIGCHYEGFSSLLGGIPLFGWVGVDIFFVLSGFLITSILVELRGTKSPIKVFYVRRGLRIFPVYYLMILLVSAISLACHEHMIHLGWYLSRFLFLQSLKSAPALFSQVYRELLGLGPHLTFFRHGPLPAAERGAELGPWANSLGAAWSLSIEEYFYIMWAPVVLFLKSPRKVALAAFSIFGTSIAVRCLGFTNQENYFEYFCRMDTIMAGAMLALFMKWRDKMEARGRKRADEMAGALAASMAAAVVCILILNRPVIGHELRDSLSFMAIGLPALSVLLALALGWVVLHRGESFVPLRILRLRPVRYLGAISYSLYLFHVPVYLGLIHLAAALKFSGYFAVLVVSLISLALSVTLSATSWKYFEGPILSLKDRWAPTRAKVPASAGVVG